jgi:hypothetical protein
VGVYFREPQASCENYSRPHLANAAVWAKGEGEMRPEEKNGMPKDPFIREKFTKERTAARKQAAEYFERYPKDRYLTEVEGRHHLQSDNIEFTIKRLRDPIDAPTIIANGLKANEAARL